MKKTFTTILIILLTISLCARKASTPAAVDTSASDAAPAETDQLKDNFEKASAYVESLIDASKTTVMTDDEEAGSLYRYWMYDNAPEQVSFSNEVDVGGTVIAIGKTLEKELEGLGFQVEASLDSVQPDEITSVTVNKDGKSSILTLKCNDTDQALPIADLPVYGFTSVYNEYTIPFSYSGLTNESTLADALKLFGEPNSSLNLCADDLGTSIVLSYFNTAQEGETVTTDSLELTFLYQADANTAVFSSIVLSHDTYPAEAE